MKELVINLIATTVLMGPIASAAQEWQQGGKKRIGRTQISCLAKGWEPRLLEILKSRSATL